MTKKPPLLIDYIDSFQYLSSCLTAHYQTAKEAAHSSECPTSTLLYPLEDPLCLEFWACLQKCLIFGTLKPFDASLFNNMSVGQEERLFLTVCTPISLLFDCDFSLFIYFARNQKLADFVLKFKECRNLINSTFYIEESIYNNDSILMTVLIEALRNVEETVMFDVPQWWIKKGFETDYFSSLNWEDLFLILEQENAQIHASLDVKPEPLSTAERTVYKSDLSDANSDISPMNNFIIASDEGNSGVCHSSFAEGICANSKESFEKDILESSFNTVTMNGTPALYNPHEHLIDSIFIPSTQKISFSTMSQHLVGTCAIADSSQTSIAAYNPSTLSIGLLTAGESEKTMNHESHLQKEKIHFENTLTQSNKPDHESMMEGACEPEVNRLFQDLDHYKTETNVYSDFEGLESIFMPRSFTVDEIGEMNYELCGSNLESPVADTHVETIIVTRDSSDTVQQLDAEGEEARQLYFHMLQQNNKIDFRKMEAIRITGSVASNESTIAPSVGYYSVEGPQKHYETINKDSFLSLQYNVAHVEQSSFALTLPPSVEMYPVQNDSTLGVVKARSSRIQRLSEWSQTSQLDADPPAIDLASHAANLDTNNTLSAGPNGIRSLETLANADANISGRLNSSKGAVDAVGTWNVYKSSFKLFHNSLNPTTSASLSVVSEGNLGTEISSSKAVAEFKRTLLFHCDIRKTIKKEAQILEQSRCCMCCKEAFTYTSAYLSRFCEYTGCYYCAKCHENSVRFIPSRIVHYGQFAAYKVCISAAQFLDECYNQPLYTIEKLSERAAQSLNPFLTIQFKLRQKLITLKSCVEGSAYSCDIAQRELLQFDLLKFEAHMRQNARSLTLKNLQELHSLKTQNSVAVWDGDVTSTDDASFLGVKQNWLNTFFDSLHTKLSNRRHKRLFIEKLKIVTNKWDIHIRNCTLCRSSIAKLCIICQSQDYLIYPFDLKNVDICNGCGNPRHVHCIHRSAQCPKCFANKSYAGLKKPALRFASSTDTLHNSVIYNGTG